MLHACHSHLAQTQDHPAGSRSPRVQAHVVLAAMLFREHLCQEESGSETENETEGDTPSMGHPHHAAAQAGMTAALADTLPGMRHVCGMFPGAQPERSAAMGVSQEEPQGSATGSMVAGSTVPEPGTSAAGSTVCEVPGTRQRLMSGSPAIQSAEPSLAEVESIHNIPDSQETM